VVFLALDAKSAAEAIDIARQNDAAVWVGSDAKPHEEHYRIAAEGVNLTRFSYPLAGADRSVLEEALATILEHHPGETVWVQRAS
jgi:hypothetical protein